MPKYGIAVPQRRTRRPQDPALGALHWLQYRIDYGIPCGTADCGGRTVVLRYQGRWHPLCGTCYLALPPAEN